MRSKVLFGFILLALTTALAAAQTCNTIKSGLITDSKGNAVVQGYDKYGYNYQAHMFNGLYENYSRPDPVVTTGTMNLVMKWSDDWLANKDCNGDGKLDRGLDPKTGTSDGISKGWCTNHFEGDYLGSDGEYHHYNEEVKIVYVGPPPVSGTDTWAANRIWGSYAIVEDVVNDAFGEFYSGTAGTVFHGNIKDLLVNPAGLGYYTN